MFSSRHLLSCSPPGAHREPTDVRDGRAPREGSSRRGRRLAPLSFLLAHPPCPGSARSVPSSNQLISLSPTYLSLSGSITVWGAAMLPAPPRPQEPAGKGGLRRARSCAAADGTTCPAVSPERGACLRPDAPNIENGRLPSLARLPKPCTNKCLLLENRYAGLQVSLPSYRSRHHSGMACGHEVKVTLLPLFSSSSPPPSSPYFPVRLPRLRLLPRLHQSAPQTKRQTHPSPFTSAGCRGELNGLA